MRTPSNIRLSLCPGLFLALLLAGCGKTDPPSTPAPKPDPVPQEKKETPRDKTPPKKEKPKVQPPKGPQEVSAVNLAGAFRADKDAADKKYGSKTIVVEGLIKEVSPSDARNAGSVTLDGLPEGEDGGEPQTVKCLFKEPPGDLKLEPGGTARVRGRCVGKLLNAVLLYDSRVVSSRPVPPEVVTRRQDEVKALETLKGLDVAATAQGAGWKVRLEGKHFTPAGLIKPEVFAPLSKIIWLRELVLERTPISNAGLEAVGRLRTLHALDLEYTPVNDAGLAHLKGLTGLRKLNLANPYRDNPGVSSAALSHLKGMTRLESLALGRTRVDDAGLAHLKGFTHLRSLRLDNTNISDAALVHLRGLTRLELLDLTRTHVSSTCLAQLKGLARLETLHLQGTSINDAGLAAIKEFPQLTVLNLSATTIGDAGLQHLAKLTSLKNLSLKDTRVGDAGLKHLVGLKKLTYLSLSKKGGPSEDAINALKKALPELAVDTE
jgi:hypothetical protein